VVSVTAAVTIPATVVVAITPGRVVIGAATIFMPFDDHRVG
jgi:hypothetical protein